MKKLSKRETDLHDLAERLRAYQLERDWSRQQMADVMNVSVYQVERALSGKGKVGPRAIYKIEKFIGKAEAA